MKTLLTLVVAGLIAFSAHVTVAKAQTAEQDEYNQAYADCVAAAENSSDENAFESCMEARGFKLDESGESEGSEDASEENMDSSL